MKSFPTIQRRRAQAGIALLISIFILLLISVVAIALIVSSGTESALAGNYRSSTSVYYDAMAGLEEARGRLQGIGPAAFKTTDPTTFLPSPGTPLAMGNTYYLVNPVSGETITPWVSGSQYADTQFAQEFSASGYVLPSSPSPTALSVWNRGALNPGSYPGPLYKWVRINAVSEKSLNVDADADGRADSTTPLYYTGTGFSNIPSAGSQVIELTAFAILPNGSQKILQYIVAPQVLSLNLPAALTLDGNTPVFGASPSPSYYVKGIDQGSVGSCNPGSTPAIALAYTDSTYTKPNFEQPGNAQGIPAAMLNNYTNGVATNPDVAAVSLSPNLSTVAGLNALVQIIEENADVVVNGSATQTSSSGPMPAAMSASNPMTIVVKGDLTFNGWRNTGYGLLLVTGDMTSPSTPALTYDPDAFWNGIILVIGKGWMNSYQGAYTTTQIQGAVLIANTMGLPATSPPVSPNFDFKLTPNTLTNGIYYSSCWIQAATPTLSYKVLSFHEIAQ
jgi:hypothetical protein